MSPDHVSASHADCVEAVRRLYTYLDGELEDSRRATVQRHLNECLPCLEAFGFEAELRVVIARKCREPVPDSLQTRISQVVQREVGTSAWQRQRRQF